MKKMFMLVLLFAIGITSAYANDSAVESAAGGLKLRKERSVLMEKERLFISEKLVRVEYEFRNTGKTAVSSEVAFPIPPYEVQYEDLDRDFKDFKAWVDGKPIKVNVEARAFVKGREVTDDLKKAGIKLEEFGGLWSEKKDEVLDKIKPVSRNRLIKIGALKKLSYLDPASNRNEEYVHPGWETHIKYYWHQEFPPGKVVRIKHEYSPVAGNQYVQFSAMKEELKDACIDDATFNEIKKNVAMRKGRDGDTFVYPTWVNYILTTANTWQTPIKDFELIIQREKNDLVTFCWDGPVENIGDGKFRADKSDFVPSKDLRIYFLKNF